MIKQSSCPRRSNASESVPATSARPPVLAKGVISGDIIAILISGLFFRDQEMDWSNGVLEYWI